MRTSKLLLGVAFATIALSSCKKEEENPDDNHDDHNHTTEQLKGSFVVNEGAWGNSNASITYIDVNGNVNQNYFNTVNGRALGDVAQSMTIAGDYGYIAVNTSGTVEIVDMTNFESAGVFSFSYPRYGVNVNDEKVLISNGSGAGKVYAISTSNNQLVDSVEVGNGPEVMILSGNNVIVTNSGGWGEDSTLSVIDATSLTVINTVTVGVNPVDIVEDANGEFWVLCKGKKEYDADWNVVGGVAPSLVHLDANLSIVNTFVIGDYMSSASRLSINPNGNTVYFLSGGVHAMEITASALPTDPLVAGYFYGLEINASGDVVVLDAPSFTENGSMKVYDTTGALLNETEVGIGPNGVIYNN